MTNGSSIKLLTGKSGLRLGWYNGSQHAGVDDIGIGSHKMKEKPDIVISTFFRSLACAGNSHPELAQAVASRLGIPLTQSTVKKFSDNETSVQIGESVREEDVYIIQVGANTHAPPAADCLRQLESFLLCNEKS